MLKIIRDNAKLYLVWLLMLVCISVGVILTKTLSLVALVMFFVFSLFSTPVESCVLLFGVLPFANIFKYAAGGTSFFTICELLVVFIAVIKSNKLKTNLFVPSILLLSFYLLVTSANSFDALVIIKVLTGFMLIYLLTQNAKKTDVINIGYLLAISTILMMLLSTNSEYYVYIEPYLQDFNFVLDEFGHASELVRAGGFFGDPNYCSVLIVMTLALLCVLYYYQLIKNEFWVFISFLIPQGFATYSKSYFLCIAFLLVFLILFVLIPKHVGWALVSIIATAIIVSMIINGRIEVINVIFDRFESTDITTGRASLNDYYLKYLWENPKVLFWGEGINADRATGAWNNVHNIYIESIFKLGIIGALLYFSALLISTKIKKRNTSKRRLVNYFPLIFFLILYYALAGITMYDLPFYLSIVFLAKDLNYLEKQTS